jgi:hypothetical protein
MHTPTNHASRGARAICFCLLSFALCLLPPALHAASAPYYLWMNLIDGSRVCSQLSLGQGWKKVGGPYKDGRCQKEYVKK